MTRIAAMVKKMYERLKDKIEVLIVMRNGHLYFIKMISIKEEKVMRRLAECTEGIVKHAKRDSIRDDIARI